VEEQWLVAIPDVVQEISDFGVFRVRLFCAEVEIPGWISWDFVGKSVHGGRVGDWVAYDGFRLAI